jgi:hypothetical protein
MKANVWTFAETFAEEAMSMCVFMMSDDSSGEEGKKSFFEKMASMMHSKMCGGDADMFGKGSCCADSSSEGRDEAESCGCGDSETSEQAESKPAEQPA